MSDNGGFGPASARMFMVASSLLAVVSLALPWFGQYPGERALVTELTDQWSGWGLAAESAQDGRVPLDVFGVIALVAAVLVLPVLAGLSGPGPRQRWITGAAAGSALALIVVSWVINSRIGGEYGADDRWLQPMFGIAVFRIALVAYGVSAARLAWLAGDRSPSYEQVA